MCPTRVYKTCLFFNLCTTKLLELHYITSSDMVLKLLNVWAALCYRYYGYELQCFMMSILQKLPSRPVMFDAVSGCNLNRYYFIRFV